MHMIRASLDELNRVLATSLNKAQVTSSRLGSMFIGEFSSGRISDSVITRLRCNASSLQYSGKTAGCLTVVVHKGELFADKQNDPLSATAGDLFIADLSRDFELRFQGLVELTLLKTAPIADLAHSTLQLIPARNVAGTLLRELLQTTLDAPHFTDCTAHQAEAIQLSFAHLLHAAVKPADTAKKDDTAPAGKHVSRADIEELAKECLRQTNLCPDFLAQRLGISRRQLYRLFDSEEGGVSQFIRTLRLEKIANDLQNPLFNDQTVSSIAERWGMGDSANFSRVFRKHFGMPPRAMREGLKLGPRNA